MKRTRAMDVYSYAMICYEIITRSQAFMSSDQSAPGLILQMIKESGQKPNKELIHGVKKTLKDENDRDICCSLEEVIIKCWNTDHQSRPSIKYVKDKLKTKALTVKLRLFKATHLTKKQIYNSSNKVSLKRFDSCFQVAVNSLQGSTSSDSITSPSDLSKANKLLQVRLFSFSGAM